MNASNASTSVGPDAAMRTTTEPGRQLDAVRLVHPATREANELLDLVATDRPHHRIDDLTRRRRYHPNVALSDRGSRGS